MSKETWGSQPESARPKPDWELDLQTQLVRAGLARTGFGETSEALFLNSGFTYTSAEQAEASFAEEVDHYLYSRFHNPTVAVFENRLATIEGAEMCLATSSGMSAMFASVACMVKSGDRVVASAAMFSSCYVVLTEILPKWGVEITLVKADDHQGWKDALSKPARVVFIESPSNPMNEVTDIAFVSDLAHKVGATVIVDNVMASPIFQKPLELGADVVMYSATKHIDGQGRVLGGAILGSKQYFTDHLLQFNRHTGPSMSPFNAWVLLKSLETMKLRVTQMCDSAKKVAEFLAGHSKIEKVNYAGLTSHPQHALAMRQMNGSGGSTLSFAVKGGKSAAFELMNRLKVIDISNNLGDSKSLITHPASSTHRRLAPEIRAEQGITESVLRLSVGLCAPSDLVKDLEQALQ
ncbi:MAG: O-succinylhomoserine sulfhydrylase [Actinomycetota bacterium]